MSAVLKPDLAEAKRHIQLLTGNRNAKCCFVALDDNKDHTPLPAKTFYGTLSKLTPELEILNRDGCGIFISVNQTTGKKRTDADILKYRAVIIENDSGTSIETPITPSFVIESSPGKTHSYFLVDNLTHFQRTALQQLLADEYGSDPAATDSARVLRLAGFYHQKKDERKGLTGNPHLVTIIEDNDPEPIQAADLLGPFGVPFKLADLVNYSDKVKAKYLKMVSELESAYRQALKGDDISQHIETIEKIKRFVSIGDSNSHPELSPELLDSILVEFA